MVTAESPKLLPCISLSNRGRAAITKLNSILWDRDVTPKTKTRIYYVIVKSAITYAAETWCLKAKMVAKLNFGDTRLDSPGRTKLGTLLLNKR